jgi:hypothetical protein
MKKQVLFCAVTILVLSGCASTAPQAGQTTSSATSAASTPAPVPSSAAVAPKASATPKAPTAAAVAAALSTKIPEISKTVQITADNDSNNLIGRPGKYTDAATLYDSRVSCTSLGVDCGATIEVWPTTSDAQARSDYIQGALKAAPALGTEYDYVNGTLLLRVTGIIKPADAAIYQEAFVAATQ